MSGPCIPKSTADAMRQQAYAARKRADANALASDNPTEARWRRLEADDMDRYAAGFLALPAATVAVGAGGEMVAIAETATERPDLVDTVRSEPDMVTARASVARLELAADSRSLDLGIDTADTIKARNSLEKMLAHQIGVAHSLAMKFAAKSEQLLGFVTSWETTGRQQVSSIEASRLANSAARMMDSFAQGLGTLDQLRNGRRQLVTVQHVTIEPGGQAVVAGELKASSSRGRGTRRK